jgi:hypothetical protein
VTRYFRDRHAETWWTLAVTGGPYGPDKPERVVVGHHRPGRLA